MPYRNAKIISIANFVGGTNQAPGFLRQARGAAQEMENLVLDLQGRPVLRKGFTEVDDLEIGTENDEYIDGDQMAVVHWLGDEDTPDGVKRVYFLPRHASWVQDENGRLLFIAAPNTPSYFIDVKENVRYEWSLPVPSIEDSISFTTMTHDGVELKEMPFRRDVNELRLGNKQIVSVFDEYLVGVATYFDLNADTDIEEVEVYVQDINGDAVALLYAGPLEQGSYRWYWDSRNSSSGAAVASGVYTGVLRVSDVTGITNDISDTTTSNFTVGSDADSILREQFAIRKQARFVCMTYANPELNIESRPGRILVRSVYDVLENTRGIEVEFDASIDGGILTDAPEWATHLYVYASRNRVPLDYNYTEAIETGFKFWRITELEKTESGFETAAKAIPFEEATLLDSYEHDGPVDDLNVIGAYGVGIWGAANNRVYFNKIGNNGEQRLYALPSANAEVPHSFPLSKSGQSPILHIHPAAHESALLAFKRDATHIIKGEGVISGLYNPQVEVTVDADASHVIVGTGTASPRSVLTVGSGVYFVGSDRRFWQYASDWRGIARLKDIGLPIQKYLNEIAEADLPNIVAFLYQNCYHLITPERVIIMDMTRNYWTSASWQLDDAIWSRGGKTSESILYGLRSDDTVIELYSGDTDGDDAIGAVWHSNPLAIPSESVLTGIMCVHTQTPPPTITCRIDVDDTEGVARDFTPAKYNDFRCGTHARGSRIQVRLESDDSFPVLDRINAEVFIAP